MNPIEHWALMSYTFMMTMTPGPTTLLVALSSARFGFLRSVPHMGGALAGYELQLVAATLGLGTLFEAVPVLAGAMKVISVLYLLHLGWRLVGSRSLSGGAVASPLRAGEAVALQLVNPKSWFMATATVTLFMDAGRAGWQSNLAMLSWAGFAGSSAMCVWAAFGSAIRGWLERPVALAAFNRTMALALLVTAGMSLWV